MYRRAQGPRVVLRCSTTSATSSASPRSAALTYSTVQYSTVQYSTVRGPHRLVPAHEGEQRGPAPGRSGAVVVGDVDGAGADQLPAEPSQPPVRTVVVEDDLDYNDD